MRISFGETLRRLRMERGLSQQQLADKLHMDRSGIAHWESGRRAPDVVMLSRLSQALGVDLSFLMRAMDEPDERPKVILVDDEKLILSGGIPVLEEALPAAEVTGFTIPSRALTYARKNQVALAFLDIELGRISGLDVCRALLELNPRTNVIFLTAYKEYSFGAWETGACGFQLKPLTVEAVRKWLPRLRYPVSGLEGQ